MAARWFETAYRRNVVDMHITADDPAFMSRFDPEAYVEALVRAEVQATVLYAHSHVGFCYFPSRVGPMHPGLKGRDILGETLALLRDRGIAAVVYMSLIYDTMAYRANPDWRIRDTAGNGVADRSRYGVCCPNSPYRDHALGIAEEVCRGYDFQGLRFDMTFWPRPCYCEHCRRRFAEEVGGDLPAVVDWEDPAWVAFQRRREAWLVEFAARQSDAVWRLKPGATAEHQSSTYTGPWNLGVTWRLAAAANDFLQGDFYGDALQGSFARKIFHNLSPSRPAGFETCISADLGNYLALKPLPLLRAKAAAALADGCAMIYIDSIDPDGALNPAAYERMGRVFAEAKAYEGFVGGELVQDAGVYLSTESRFDPGEKGRSADAGPTGRLPHVEAALSVCRTLIENHVPYGVITGANLAQLARHRVVVLPRVLMMDDEEAEAFREYVRGGGALYASGETSLLGADGRRRDDFALADVFGASWRGVTKEAFTYIAPAEGSEHLFGYFTREHPAGLYAPQMVVEARPGAEVLGTTVLPYTDPADPDRFASIHNNPPGRWTSDPAIVLNQFGDGRAIYVTADLEAADPHRDLVMALLAMLGAPFTIQADAPKCVELTAFRQAERRRLLISLVSFQKDLPNVPVRGVVVRVRPEQMVRRVLLLPGETELPFDLVGDVLAIEAPEIETLRMLAVDF